MILAENQPQMWGLEYLRRNVGLLYLGENISEINYNISKIKILLKTNLYILQVCYAPVLGGAWLMTLGCVLLGCVCVTITIGLLALSHCRISLHFITYARWFGFSASKSSGYIITWILWSPVELLTSFIVFIFLRSLLFFVLVHYIV